MAIELKHTQFSPADITATAPALKIGLLATLNPQGLPHLTLISSLKAAAPGTVTFGQFMGGLSKQHIGTDPRAAFLIMTLDKQLWRGKARWTHAASAGPEFEAYNNIPMFRYNAYFGIHTVHFLDLLGQTGQQPLPMGAVVLAALQTMLARTLRPASRAPGPMNGWTQSMFNKLDHLKFLAFVDADGYPYIIPIIQAQANGPQQVVFSAGPYGSELKAVPAGSQAAVLGLGLTMEDVLVRGTYRGLQRRAGVACAALDVEWVYNPMPPVPGQIYPPLPLEAVRL